MIVRCFVHLIDGSSIDRSIDRWMRRIDRCYLIDRSVIIALIAWITQSIETTVNLEIDVSITRSISLDRSKPAVNLDANPWKSEVDQWMTLTPPSVTLCPVRDDYPHGPRSRATRARRPGTRSSRSTTSRVGRRPASDEGGECARACRR